MSEKTGNKSKENNATPEASIVLLIGNISLIVAFIVFVIIIVAAKKILK
jgi:hypothetical protein